MNIGCQPGFFTVTGGRINFNLPSSTTTYTATSTVPFYNLNISRGSGTTTDTIQWQNSGSALSVLNDLTIGGNTVLNLKTNAVDLAVGHNLTIASGGAYTPGTANSTTFNGTGAQAFSNIGKLLAVR